MEQREFSIRLLGTEALRDFCALLALYPNPADLLAEHYVVNARSVMGILSLDLTKPVTLRLYGPVDEALEQALQKFGA